MKKSNIKDQLDRMKGKSFRYRGKVLEIIDYALINGQIRIDTNQSMIKFNLSKASTELDEFEPVTANNSLVQYDHEQVTESTYKKDSRRMGKMEDVLMDNIEGLQNGDLDIDAAKEINSSVKTMLDISKQRLKMLKEMRKSKEMGQ